MKMKKTNKPINRNRINSKNKLNEAKINSVVRKSINKFIKEDIDDIDDDDYRMSHEDEIAYHFGSEALKDYGYDDDDDNDDVTSDDFDSLWDQIADTTDAIYNYFDNSRNDESNDPVTESMIEDLYEKSCQLRSSAIQLGKRLGILGGR